MDVGKWLQELGLDQYASAFEANDVDAQTLRELTDRDLVDIGVRSVGHRRKIMLAIGRLQALQGQRPAAQPTCSRQAERRPIAVMYCELVESDALSQLDMEAGRELIRSFHQMCVQQLQEFDGWAANFFGHRLLAYFGWPHAHEDDAQRAVRAGLAMVRAARGLCGANDAHLHARVSVASGLVVVGDLIREGPAREQSAVGLVPNLGARLLELAAPEQLVANDLTRRLLGPGFVTQPLGEHVLKGIELPVAVWAVSGERSSDSRFDARVQTLTPMVGRQPELAMLLERWGQAQAGEGQGVLLVGEAGGGKSRLARAVLDACAQPCTLLRWQCSPHRTGSALWPVIQQLGHTAGLHEEEDDHAGSALDRLEAVLGGGNAETTALYATLLGLNGTQRYGPLEMSPKMQRERTLELLLEQLLDTAGHEPLLLLVEDLHWIDPTTQELLARCLDSITTAPMMVLLTSRPDPRLALADRLGITQLSLNRLSRANVLAMVLQLAGDRLPPPALEAIVMRSDGVPLFVEELTRAALESGEATAVPVSLHGSLMARLDRIPEVTEVAQVAACLGREFDLRQLQAMVEAPQTLNAALDKLASAELIFARGKPGNPKFSFKHALTQEAIHESILRNQRLAIHARILQFLESQDESTPEILAYHAEHAKLHDKAIDYRQQAGRLALAKAAYLEAAGHFGAAIRLLESQTDSVARRQREMPLQNELAAAFMGSQGYAAEGTQRALDRACELLDDECDQKVRISVLSNAWAMRLIQARFQQALGLAEQLARELQTGGSAVPQSLPRWMMGVALFFAGNARDALVQLDAALSQHEPLLNADAPANQAGLDHGTNLYLAKAWALAILGRIDECRTLLQRAHGMAVKLVTVTAKAQALVYCGVVAECIGDGDMRAKVVDPLASLAQAYRLPMYLGYAALFTASAARRDGRADEAVEHYRRGLQMLYGGGSQGTPPLYEIELADCLAGLGRLGQAHATLDKVMARLRQIGPCWWEPEYWRARGGLCMHEDGRDWPGAERSLQMALSIARARGARLWELRAATGMCRLLADQGRFEEAYEALSTVHDSFPQTVDMPDLGEARALLERLRHRLACPR